MPIVSQSILLYGSEAVLLSASHRHSLNNCRNRAVYKIFGVSSAEGLKNIRNFVGLYDVVKSIQETRSKFIDRLLDINSFIDLFFVRCRWYSFSSCYILSRARSMCVCSCVVGFCVLCNCAFKLCCILCEMKYIHRVHEKL